MPISGCSLSGLQQFHFYVLVFLIPSVGSLRSCSSSDCFSKVMPPRKKRRPAAGDDLSAKKSRHDGYVILPWAKTGGISKDEQLIWSCFQILMGMVFKFCFLMWNHGLWLNYGILISSACSLPFSSHTKSLQGTCDLVCQLSKEMYLLVQRLLRDTVMSSSICA